MFNMNNDFEQLKQEYMSITSDTSFKERIDKIMKKERRKKRLIYSSTGIAAALAVCVLTLNCFPKMAIAAQTVPFLGNIVNVLTFGRFIIKDGGYEANIVTPQITGLMDKDLEEKLNTEFKENADAIKKEFISDMESMKKEFGNDAHSGITMDYTVKTNNDSFLSLDVYIVNVVGSSSTQHKYYNINKKTNKLLTLDEIYGKNKDYRQTLTDYINKVMVRRNQQEDGMFWPLGDEFSGEDTKKALDNADKFYINDNGKIVVCFDKYEISAGAQGCPEFEIPNNILKPSFE